MKNKKTFAVIVILFLLVALSIPFLAESFYDPDGGEIYATSWTYWNPDQPEMSMPYLDINTMVRGINNTHPIDEVTTSLYQFGCHVLNYYNYGGGNFTDYYYPVSASDANYYSSLVTFCTFD